MTELQSRANEIQAAAAKCVTVQDLSRLILVNGKPCPISFAARANAEFNLGLEWVRPNRAGKPRPGVAVPKPVKGKKGGE
jgi:hypothetical protein